MSRPRPRPHPWWRQLALLLALLALPACSESTPTIAPLPAERPAAVASPTQAAMPTPAPAPVVASGPTGAGTPDLSGLSLEVKIGQLLMAGVLGPELDADARRLIGELHVGNVVLLDRNAVSPTQVRRLTQDLQALARTANGVGLLIAVDQEGGAVQRLRAGFTLLPDAATVGASRRPDLARALGEVVGAELRAVGVTMNLAPVLDVNDTPYNPVIGRRACGATPEVVERMGLAYLEGLRAAGVVAVGKHFPGHGSTTLDSHATLPVVAKDRAALEATELRPFRAAIAHGLEAVMTAHVAYPALDPMGLPATLSAPILTDLLRGALGFQGVILTDDLGMGAVAERWPPDEAAVQAVRAGADIVVCARLTVPGACPPEALARIRDGLLAAVREGRLPLARVDAAVGRILALKARYRVGEAPNGDLAQVGSAAHRGVVAAILDAARHP
jgi:beta-N-acetylhexosaminidase